MKRYDIINLLIDKFNLKSYLEIGVFKGENFDKIKCDIKRSIDPEFTATYKMTSDEFFNNENYTNLFSYGLVFVDGLHTAEQAYKDIVNAYGILDKGGFIVVHDCNPATEWHTRPPEEYKRGEEWNGSTYQGFIKFKEENPELTCFTVDADYGCGVVSDRPILKNEICDNYWDHFVRHRAELLQLVDVKTFNSLV